MVELVGRVQPRHPLLTPVVPRVHWALRRCLGTRGAPSDPGWQHLNQARGIRKLPGVIVGSHAVLTKVVPIITCVSVVRSSCDGRATPTHEIDHGRWSEAEHLTQPQWVDVVTETWCTLDLEAVTTILRR